MVRTPGKEVESQQSRAYALYVIGYSYTQISRELGITTKHASNLVTAERNQLLQYMTDDDRQARIHLELERLDSLQAAYWHSAMSGMTNDAKVVLDVIKTRIKLLQLDVGQQHTTNQILIAGGDKEEFMEILRAAQMGGLPGDNGIVEGEVVEEEK